MRFLPTLLTRNWAMKLAAFVLALLLWTSVRVESPNRSTLGEVPVRIQLNDPRWALSGDPSPARVRVQVSGPAREVFRLAVGGTALVIPIDDVTARDTTILLRNSWVSLAGLQGVVVEDIDPRSVRVGFERIAAAAFPVALRLEGALDEELAFSTDPVIEPGEVRVSGPQGRIQALDSIPTAPFDLGGLGESGTVRIAVDPELADSLSLAPDSVMVSFTIEGAVERVVAGVPVRVPGDGDFVAEPASVALTLRGARSRIEALDREALAYVVPASAVPAVVGPDGARVPVRLMGVPTWVAVAAGTDSVTIRPRAGGGGGR